MQEGQGWAQVALPFYDQPLWNDTGSPIKAPTLQTVASVGAAIAGAVFSGGTSLLALAGSAAINFAERAVFTGLAYANGLVSGADALLDLGKDALSGAASVATSELGMGLNGLTSKLTGAQGVIANTLASGATDIAGNVAQSAISSVTFSGGQLGFDTNAFAQETVGAQAVAGYLGGMAQTAVTGALGSLDLQDSNGIKLSNRVFNTRQIGSFNNLAGSAVDAVMQYGMTGQTTLNMLDFRDIAGLFGTKAMAGYNSKPPTPGAPSVGMLELTLGGSGGWSLGMGSGGINMSVGMIAQGLSGLSEAGKVVGFKLAGVEGNSTLNGINMLGYTNVATNIAVARAIKNRQVEVDYGTMAANKFGKYDKNDPNAITINKEFLGGGVAGAADLAAVLSHEGTHYDGNQVEGLAYAASAQTYAELAKEFHVGDPLIANAIAAGLANPKSWTQEDTGPVDYWEYKNNGNGTVSLIANGKADITDANGNIIVSHDPKLLAQIDELKDERSFANTPQAQASVEKQIAALQQQYDATNKAGVSNTDVGKAILSLSQSPLAAALMKSDPTLLVDLSWGYSLNLPFSRSEGPANLLPDLTQVPSARQLVGQNALSSIMDKVSGGAVGIYNLLANGIVNQASNAVVGTLNEANLAYGSVTGGRDLGVDLNNLGMALIPLEGAGGGLEALGQGADALKAIMATQMLDSSGAIADMMEIQGFGNLLSELESVGSSTSDAKLVSGFQVYQDNSIIDPSLIDRYGMTNLERMQNGLAPIGPDGRPINLHHIDQTMDGPLQEITSTDHQQYYDLLHLNTGQYPSEIDRSSFDTWREQYWILRARNWENQ